MNTSRTRVVVTSFALVACLAAPASARADWRDWLRSKIRSVERGNEKLLAGDAKGALAEYDKAAREAPSEGGVHLDRGLALMQTGDVAAAREALRLATQPPGSREVRADAYYDLGLGFYREGDTLAGEERHEEAQQLFREAKDAFRESLRLRAGNRDAAWNLELATRRLREQEDKQKQKEEQEKQEKKEDEGEQEKQDGGEGEPGEQGEPNPDATQDQKPGDQESQEPKPKDGQKEAPKPEPAQPPKQGGQQKSEPQPSTQDAAAKPLPADVGHALDALQDSEQNLERLKAQMRARQERRAPEKDW